MTTSATYAGGRDHAQKGIRVPGLSVTGGDDLTRTRNYFNMASRIMTAILTADRRSDADTGRDPHWLSERLAEIQSGAKRLRALAIYRSAQEIVTLIQGRHHRLPTNWSVVDGRLCVLNKLIMQYGDGLKEIEDHYATGTETDLVDVGAPDLLLRPFEDAPVSQDLPDQQPDTAATVVRYGRSVNADMSPTDGPDDRATMASKSDTLETLLPHASPDERQALCALMSAHETLATPLPPSNDHFDPSEDRSSLSDALPDLIQTLLNEGRVYGKTLSVSYALDDIVLAEDARDALISRLHARLSDLIAGSMPLQGVGHLDLSADGNTMTISGSGFDPVTIDIEVNTPVTDGHDVTPSTQRMITDANEAELRARLNALMDTGMRNESGAYNADDAPVQGSALDNIDLVLDGGA